MGSQSKLNIRRVSTAKKIILHIKSAIMFLKSFILFTLLISFTTSIPAPLDDMEIYTQCKAQFGTTQNVECRSSQDCSINSSFKCPEHDCLPGRQGRSFCTWQVY